MIADDYKSAGHHPPGAGDAPPVPRRRLAPFEPMWDPAFFGGDWSVARAVAQTLRSGPQRPHGAKRWPALNSVPASPTWAPWVGPRAAGEPLPFAASRFSCT